MKWVLRRSECLVAASSNVVTITPFAAASARRGVEATSSLFRNDSVARGVTELRSSAALAAKAFADGRLKPSNVSVPVLLKRHASSPRFGIGSDANVENAARLRASHQAGA